MKFAVAGQETEQVEFSLSIDDDGDLVVSAKKSGIDEDLFYIDSESGKINRYHGVSEKLGLSIDEDGRLLVSE